MRNFKWVVKIAVLLILFLGIEQCLGFFLSPNESYTRVMLHEAYTEENVDLVFAGASHAYRSFDPRIFDEELGTNSFNLGSSSQRTVDTYYVLKEMLKTHEVKRVVFELAYSSFNYYDWTDNPVPFLILYDFFKPSTNKVEYLFNGLPIEYWPEALFKTYRYKDYFSVNYLKDSFQGKVINEQYRNYAYPESATEAYVGKGFVYSTACYQEGNMGIAEPYAWNSDRIYQESLDYFDKIMKLCAENDVEVILTTAPVPVSSLIYMQNYDETHLFFKDLAAQYGLEYYDFNLVRPEVFPRPDQYFYDASHMNGAAAQHFSEVFVQFLKEYDAGTLSPEDYFYNSFDEMWSEVREVTAVGLEQQGDLLTAQSLQGKYVIPEFEFSVKQEDGTYEVLQKYSENNSFPYTTQPGDIIRVNARSKDSEDEYQAYWEIEIPLE